MIEDITHAVDEEDNAVAEEPIDPILINQEAFRFSTNKDKYKTPITTEFKTGDYDLVSVATSDESLDLVTIHQERLTKLKKAKKQKIIEEKVFNKELQDTLHQVKKLGSQNEINLHLMNILSQDTHDGMYPEGAIKQMSSHFLDFPFDEDSAIGFIAGDDESKVKILQTRETQRQDIIQQSKIDNFKEEVPLIDSQINPEKENPGNDLVHGLKEAGLWHSDFSGFQDKTEVQKLKKFKNIRNNLLKIGNIRKICFNKVDLQNLYADLDNETQEERDKNNKVIDHIRSYTPIFGSRPFINMSTFGQPCRLLFDSGANCSAFTKPFLSKLEKQINKPLKLGDPVDIHGYIGQTKQDTTMIEVTNDKIPGRTWVPAVIDPNISEDFDGVLGTNLMETFHLGIQFPRGNNEKLIITYQDPKGRTRNMDAVIKVDGETEPLHVDDVHARFRRTRNYEPYDVALNDPLNYVPGKFMKIQLKIPRYSSDFKTAKGLSMVFVPNPAFEDIFQQAEFHISSVFSTSIKAIGKLSNNDSRLEKLYTKGRSLYEKGIETKMLPALWEEGHVIGKAYPTGHKKAEFLINKMALNQLDLDGQVLERAEGIKCICHLLKSDQKHTIVFFGNKYGFNYHHRLQYIYPNQNFEKAIIEPHFRQKENLIVFKKHCDQDKYAIDKEKLVLHDQVIVLTSYREDLTPGQLKAIHELQEAVGPTPIRYLKHQNDKCKKCATMACQYAEPKDSTQLLTRLMGVDIYYSISGTQNHVMELDQRSIDVPEHIYSINGVAKLQTYKVQGHLQIRVHMYAVEHMWALVNNMMYVQAYLLNQFRILRLPKKLQIFGSWKMNENEQNPLHKVISCMRTCDIWEEDEGAEEYEGVQPNTKYKPLEKRLFGCKCKTCLLLGKDPNEK